MNYIIYDLEFNQELPVKKATKKKKKTPLLPFEIIQIGAIKLDENFNTIETFNTFVKPIVHTTLHPYVERLTNLTIEELQSARSFTKAYRKFIKFIGSEPSTLCVWGTADIHELIKNVQFHQLDQELLPINFIDIQLHASQKFSTPSNSRIGLRNAVELLAISIEGQFHDAFHDAYYTSEVFKKIYTPSMEPQPYVPPEKKPSRIKQPKKKLDVDALFHQVEKTYQRKLTPEEQSMIKFGYIMGRTNQFLIEE